MTAAFLFWIVMVAIAVGVGVLIGLNIRWETPGSKLLTARAELEEAEIILQRRQIERETEKVNLEIDRILVRRTETSVDDGGD